MKLQGSVGGSSHELELKPALALAAMHCISDVPAHINSGAQPGLSCIHLQNADIS